MAIGKRTTRRRTYRRSRKSIRRRRYNKRFRRGAKSGIMMKMPSTMVPPRMLTRVKYTNTVTLTGFTVPTTNNDNNAFSFKDIQIAACNPYAPYGINASDLPAGLTLWSQFYGEVAVTKCKVRVFPVSFKASSTDPYILPYMISITPVPQYWAFGGGPPPNTSANTDWLEQPMTRRKYFSVGGNNAQASITTTVYVNAQPSYQIGQSVSHSMTTKKMVGYSKLYDCDQLGVWSNTYTTTTGNLGHTAWYYNIGIKSTLPWDGTSATGPFTMDDLVCKIEIEYSLAFRDRTIQQDEIPPTP